MTPSVSNARLAYGLVVVLAFTTLLVLARDMGFRGDDWDLIVNRSLADPIGLMRPFNEQWVAVPAVIFRLVFAVVGMHSYLPYLAVLLALHVLVAEAVRRLATRTSGPMVGYVAATVVLFLGAGSENLTWAFQIGMVASAACGFWAIESLESGRHPAVAAVLLVFAAASHAVAAAFLVGAFVVGSRHGRAALAWVAVPAVVLAGWVLVFDLPALGVRGSSFAGGVTSIAAFVAGGVAAAAGALFGLGSGGGVVVVAGLLVLAARFQRRPRWPHLAMAFLAVLVAEYGLVALSRSQFGLPSVSWSRYLYVAAPLVLLAASAWFGSPSRATVRWRPGLTAGLAALTVVAVAGNLRMFVLGRDLQLEHVHRARAAAAIVIWAPNLHDWEQDLQLPAPDALRRLIEARGSPAKDDLIPAVVPEVPVDVAVGVCRQLAPAGTSVDPCLEAVLQGVGG